MKQLKLKIRHFRCDNPTWETFLKRNKNASERLRELIRMDNVKRIKK